jgi:tRNA(fMet)-specific endonuclease VapC
MYALDTNTLIYFFNGMGDVAQKLFDVPPSEVAIPSVVLFELEMGIALSTSLERRRRQLQTLRESVRVLPFDDEAARAAARIGAALKKSGKPIGPMDTLIAGTAAAVGAILVTHNVLEFQRVPGLKTVDWF